MAAHTHTPDGEEGEGEVPLRMVCMSRQSGVEVVVVHNRCLWRESDEFRGFCEKSEEGRETTHWENPAIFRINEESPERFSGKGDRLSS